jgi:N-acyl homoserine lactone hydrolase
VSTASGTAVLTGDPCYSYYNLNPTFTEMTDLAGTEFSLVPRPDLPFLPPAIYVSLKDWYDSMCKVVARASSRDLVIPGHDPSLPGKVFG